MTTEQQGQYHQKIQYLRDNFPEYAKEFIKIRPKTGGKAVPMVLNRAQQALHKFLADQLQETGMVRACVIKGRQQGVSTYVNARFLHRATLFPGTSVFILAHLTKSTDYLFDMVKRMYNNLPEPLQPAIKASNKKELKFGSIDSEYALGTAGSEDIGRGMTPLLLHCSEAAFFKNTDELTTGLFQGVPVGNGSEIIMESTANGVNNLFYHLCVKGVDPTTLSRFKTLFLPWYWQEEYSETPPKHWQPNQEDLQLMDTYDLTLDQVFWRRRKLETDYNNDLWKFKQEYPMYMAEAFVTSGDTLIPGHQIATARKYNATPDEMAPKVLGVDGARSGDRTVLVLRQGKRIVWYRVYQDMDQMRLAGIIAKDVDEYDIDMVFLDVAQGYGTRDRLHEMGYSTKVQGVHFGERPINDELYANKRAEMYGFLREWFEEGGADIPDEDDFHNDLLMIPGWKTFGSRGRLQLPSKDDIKKENEGRSPDIGDAAALTLAYPVKGRAFKNRIKTSDINVSRAHSPFKSRRLAHGCDSANKEKPSEYYINRG